MSTTHRKVRPINDLPHVEGRRHRRPVSLEGKRTISWGVPDDNTKPLRPTGPFDPDFPVMAFKRPDQSLTAVIFGHAAHNVIGQLPSRSPMFYGLAGQAFEEESRAVTTFIEGAAGSTHPGPKATYDDGKRRILNAIRYHVDQAPEMSVVRIGSPKKEVTVKVRNFNEETEEKAVSSCCTKWQGVADGKKNAAVFQKARKGLTACRGQERKTRLSATRIGDVAIVGVPAELFTQLGLDIKKRSPFLCTFIAELANDYVGYVGNADAYRLGGYQLWMGRHSWTERGTSELFVNQAVDLLSALYTQSDTNLSSAPLYPQDRECDL